MTAPYLKPVLTTPLPGGLSLNQFLQTVFVGISGLPGTLVRPSWQVEPPKNPDITVDWMAFGIELATPDAYAYVDVNENEETISQRHEVLTIACAFYGPNALDFYGLVRDGFQLQPNLYALQGANMGFVGVDPGRQVPDLLHQRWVPTIRTNVSIRREIQRVYPIPTLVSASGTIHTVVGNEDYLLDWTAGP